MRIGLIGAGLMGHGMAVNMMKGGHEVTVIAHRNRQPIEDLVAQGAREAKSLPELAEVSDVIFLCVSTAKVVEATVETLKPHLRAGRSSSTRERRRPKPRGSSAGNWDGSRSAMPMHR